jgi:hypothetical protein
MQLPVVVSQIAVVPLHTERLVLEHCWHEPLFVPPVWQAGLLGSVQPPAVPSPVQGPHVCATGSHFGVAPEQLAFVVHDTQVPVVRLHCLPEPHAVAFVAEHCPHEPFDSQAGVLPPHCVSPVHRAQVPVAGLQAGNVAGQSAFF